MEVSSHNQQLLFAQCCSKSFATVCVRVECHPNICNAFIVFCNWFAARLFISMLCWSHSIPEWGRIQLQHSHIYFFICSFRWINFSWQVRFDMKFEEPLWDIHSDIDILDRWRCRPVMRRLAVNKWQVILNMLGDKFMCDKLEALARKSCWH